MLEISKRSVGVGVGVWKVRIDELSVTVCQSLLSSFRLPVMLMVFIFSVFINSNNKDFFLCITHTVEHNYMSHSSAVGIQLHVSALYVGHLQVLI